MVVREVIVFEHDNCGGVRVDYMCKNLPLTTSLRRAVDEKGIQRIKDCPVQRSF